MKKEIRKKLLVCLGFAFAICLQIIFNTYAKQEAVICRVFADNNVMETSGELVVTAGMWAGYMTEEDIEGLLKHISGLADIESSHCTIEKKEGKWQLTGSSKDVKITVNTGEFNEGKETIIYMLVESENGEYIGESAKILELRNNILEFCKEMKMDVLNDSLVLKGCYPGRLSNEFIENNTQEIYKKMGGKIASGKYVDGRYISYGYTRLIGDYIVTQGDKMNLNIVYVYEEEDNQTKMYMATPLINLEY